MPCGFCKQTGHNKRSCEYYKIHIGSSPALRPNKPIVEDKPIIKKKDVEKEDIIVDKPSIEKKDVEQEDIIVDEPIIEDVDDIEIIEVPSQNSNKITFEFTNCRISVRNISESIKIIINKQVISIKPQN